MSEVLLLRKCDISWCTAASRWALDEGQWFSCDIHLSETATAAMKNGGFVFIEVRPLEGA